MATTKKRTNGRSGRGSTGQAPIKNVTGTTPLEVEVFLQIDPMALGVLVKLAHGAISGNFNDTTEAEDELLKGWLTAVRKKIPTKKYTLSLTEKEVERIRDEVTDSCLPADLCAHILDVLKIDAP